MADEQVQHAPIHVKRIDADTALGIVRALHTDLNIRAVVNRLHTFVSALSKATHIHYINEMPDIECEVGKAEEHSLSYELKLTSQSESAGSITMSSSEPFSDADCEVIEELLSLAANALMNAYKFYATRNAQRPNSDIRASANLDADDNPDALILVRIDGLDIVRNSAGQETADKIIFEVNKRLSTSLRVNDDTMRVDDDHLAVMLPSTATNGAQKVAEKVAQVVDDLDFVDPLLKMDLSVSVGISATRHAGSTQAVLANAKGKLSQALEFAQTGTTIH